MLLDAHVNSLRVIVDFMLLLIIYNCRLNVVVDCILSSITCGRFHLAVDSIAPSVAYLLP
jgi:hypothetical protein